MPKVKQKIDLPVCPYVRQECNRGNKPCPEIGEASNMAEWKSKAEARAGCQFSGDKLTISGYEQRFKLVNER